METIGLIAAMPQESAAILRCLGTWKRITRVPFRGYRFDVSGHACVLVTSGMGIRRARQATRDLLELNSPRFLISFGIAGAVEAVMEIGDVVIADATCLLDQGVPGPRLPLTPWPEAARQLMIRALERRGARLFNGTAVTTLGSQFVEYRAEEMLHPILEMETVGIAEAAAERKIPLLSLRAISDGPCAPFPFNLNVLMDKDANLHVSGMLKVVVHHPRIILQSRQLVRNTRIAADNAALALVAALGWLVSNPIL